MKTKTGIDVRHMWEIPRPDPERVASGFPILETVEHSLIYRASRETGAYSHHARLHHNGEVFQAIWSNHRFGEDAAGQRVLYSRSGSNGRDWVDWIEAFPSPCPMGPFEEPGIHLSAGGLISIGSEAYAIARVAEITAFENYDGSDTVRRWDPDHRRPVRVRYEHIARSISATGEFGPIFGVGNGTSANGRLEYAVPSAETAGRTVEAHTISETLNRPTLPSGEGSRHLCEPVYYESADGAEMLLLRDDDYSHRMYVSDWDGGSESWLPAVPTDIPDSPSLSKAVNLDDGSTLLIGNQMAPEFDNPDRPHYDRDPLMVSFSADGRRFTSAFALRIGQQEWRVPRSEVKGRGGGGQYPDAIVIGDMLYVIYSMGKEDIWFTSVEIDEVRSRNQR